MISHVGSAPTVRAVPAFPTPSAVEELHQAHRHGRNVGHQHQQRKQRRNERQVGPGRRPDLGTGDGAGGDEHAGHRRRLLSDGEIE